ncbi:MAG: hypothetical protein E6G46_07980 [Actinobacteria bacterium]|nr:MAG: hypothetical protein E6G46_07980 [Actinomycetota bacterium]
MSPATQSASPKEPSSRWARTSSRSRPASQVATGVASALVAELRELLTVLTGEGVSIEEREQLRAALATELPRTTIEIYDGGQPFHRYVMAAE